MSDKHNNFVKELKQIKQKQERLLEEFDFLKQNSNEDEIADLERIENTGFRMIMDIDETCRKHNQNLADSIERRTILFRMRDSGKKPERIGNVRI